MIPPGFAPGFDSGRRDCGDRNGMGRLLEGSLQLYFCQLLLRVSLLVFVLVSAAIRDENGFKFNRLWY